MAVEYEKSVIWEDERVNSILCFLNSLIIKNAQEADIYETSDSFQYYRTHYESLLHFTEKEFREENDFPLNGTMTKELNDLWKLRQAEIRFQLGRYVDKNKYYAQMTGKPSDGEEILVLNLDHPMFDTVEFDFTPIIRSLEQEVLGPPPNDIVTLASVLKKRNLYRTTFSTFFGNRYENYGADGGERLSFLSNKHLVSLGEPAVPDLSIKKRPLNSDYIRDELNRMMHDNPSLNISIDILVNEFKELVDRTTGDEESLNNYTNPEITGWCIKNNIPLLYIMIHELDRNKQRVTYNLMFSDRTLKIVDLFRDVYKYTYLNFLHAGLRIEKIREAEHFDIVSYERAALDDIDLNNFFKVYDEVKEIVQRNKHIIALEEVYAAYSNFEIMVILFGTFQRMCSAYIDRYSIRNYTDIEVDDILDSHNLSVLKQLKNVTKRNIVEAIDIIMAYRGTEEILNKIIGVIVNDARLSILKYDLHKGYSKYEDNDRDGKPALNNEFSYNNNYNTKLAFSSRIIATNDFEQRLLVGDIHDDYDAFVMFDKYWAGQQVFPNWFTRDKALRDIKNAILALPFNKLDTKYIGVMTKVDMYARYIDMIYKIGFLMQYGTEDISTGSLLNIEDKIGLETDITYTFDGIEWSPSQLFTLCAAIQSHIDFTRNTVFEDHEEIYSKVSKSDPMYDVIRPELFQFKGLARLVLLEEDQIVYDLLDKDDGATYEYGPFSWNSIKEFMLIKLSDEEKEYQYGKTTEMDAAIDAIVQRFNEELKNLRVSDQIKAIRITSRNATFFVTIKEDYEERIKFSKKTGISLFDLDDASYGDNILLSKREKSYYDAPIPTFNNGLPSSLDFTNIIANYNLYKTKLLGNGGIVDRAHTSDDLVLGRAWEKIVEYFYTDVSIEGDYAQYINSRDTLLEGDGEFVEYDPLNPIYSETQIVRMNGVYFTCKRDTFEIDEDSGDDVLIGTYEPPYIGDENDYWRPSDIAPRRNTFYHYFQDQGDPQMLALYEDRVLNAPLRYVLGEDSYLFQYWKLAQVAFVNSVHEILDLEKDVYDTDASYKEGLDLTLLIQTLVSIYVEMRDVAIVLDNTSTPEDGRMYFHDRHSVSDESTAFRDNLTISTLDSDKVVQIIDNRYEETIDISERVIITALDSHTDTYNINTVQIEQTEFTRKDDLVEQQIVLVTSDDSRNGDDNVSFYSAGQVDEPDFINNINRG